MTADILPRPDRPVDELFAPRVWMVVAGSGRPGDTIECLHSLQASTYNRLSMLYVDNGSREDHFRQVVAAFPGLAVLRRPALAGTACAINDGLAHAMERGADCVGLAGPDILFDPEAIGRLVHGLLKHPQTGMIVPKIFRHAQPETVWSAGAKWRRFPPAVLLKGTREADDGRYDADTVLEFAPYCACLFRRDLLERIGLVDPAYRMFWWDHDHCLRIRRAGREVRLEPGARAWRRAPESAEPAPAPDRFHASGHDFRRFGRRFPDLPGVANPLGRTWWAVRALVAGGRTGWRAYRAGLREAAAEALPPEPAVAAISGP